MARIYSKDHGKSSSVKPYSLHQIEDWSTPAADVIEHIQTLAKKGVAPSKIGLLLRDLHGVGSVSNLTGKRICAILRTLGLAPVVPEDLTSLVRRSATIKAHLSVFKSDKHAGYRLGLNNSKLYRLASYYVRKGYVKKGWKPNFAKVSN